VPLERFRVLRAAATAAPLGARFSTLGSMFSR
jgi:hypothetical protein